MVETSSTSTEGAGEGTRCGTVALIGRPNVGKSSILNAILGTKIAPTTRKAQTTRRQLRGVATHGEAQIVFVDTPGVLEPRHGLHRFMVEEALGAVRDVDVIAFVIAVEVSKDERGAPIAAFSEEDERVLRTVEEAGARGKPSILVVNKVDVLPDRALLLPFLKRWGEAGTFEEIVPVSAVKHLNLDRLLDVLGRRLPEGPFVFPPDALTDATERDIAAELVREKCMLELEEEVPYRLAVTIEEFDESRRDDPKKPLVTIAAVIHVEKDSQKAIVIGKGGARIKVIGQRARKDLEHLLGCQVMLELLVRVEKDWTTDARGLRKLGYVHQGGGGEKPKKPKKPKKPPKKKP